MEEKKKKKQEEKTKKEIAQKKAADQKPKGECHEQTNYTLSYTSFSNTTFQPLMYINQLWLIHKGTHIIYALYTRSI